MAVITFKQNHTVNSVLKSEYHEIDGHRLRVRQHTRSPMRVLAVISATPGAEGLPQVSHLGVGLGGSGALNF